MQHQTLIQQTAQELWNTLQHLLPQQPTEADLRRRVDPIIERFCEQISLTTPDIRSEMTLASGRADAVFNRFVLEYERPGVLSSNLHHRATAHAVDQLKRYMRALSQKTRHDVHRMAGVALDGHYLIFARYVEDKFTAEPPVSVSPRALERMLTWLAALTSDIALTPDHLARDFGIEQRHTQQTLHALYHGLQRALSEPESLVGKLFEQWRTLFREAIDYSEAFGAGKLQTLQKWVGKAGIDIRSSDEAERFFFALHTYFALLVKLVARLAVWRTFADKLGLESYQQLASLPAEQLWQRLHEIESGDLFRKVGIQNLLEGDFFAWYLRAWNDETEQAIRSLLQQLGQYDPTTLSLVPEETRDLFKKLYHYLLPREVRHNLGEYYTPDWLAQRLLTQLDNELFHDAARAHDERRLRQKVVTTRFLDPACGSGTFLVLILARLQPLGKQLFISEAELLDALTRNVVGFDINPLAVLTARVNYLLAIADLLPYRTGEVALPIYLADSVRMPAQSENLLSGSVYEFPTAVGVFHVPAEFCTPDRFSRLCDLLEECVHSGVAPEVFVQRVGGHGSEDTLTALYTKMRALHQRGLNGLWARVLKNNFAPLTVGQFDYVVGNPPWVNWEHLPDKYRDEIGKLWEQYRLPPPRSGGRLGAVKGDLSALMTLVVAHKLLRPEGKLGFVITQSLFKTAAGAGFRRLKLPDNTPLRVLHIDDMVDLNPFEGASNRTAVMILRKGQETRYPVPYTLWRKRKGSRFTYTSTLDEVIAATMREQWQAEPAQPQDLLSQWLTAPKDALKAIRKGMGEANYTAHLGVNTGGANAVYWVEKQLERPDGLWLVRNLTEGAKRKVREVVEPIEPDLLYPLLRGRDVQRWRAQPSAWIIVPQDPNAPNRAYPEAQLQLRYPKTYAYLKQFENVLRERSGYKQLLSKRESEFYGLMDINAYSFAPWKVVWTRIGTVVAAVVGKAYAKPVLAQETISLVACDTEDEAHYITALVNSTPAQSTIATYSQEGGKSMGTPHILEHIRIPRYDDSNPVHRQLAELSRQAHAAAERAADKELARIEAEIDPLAAQVWGLTHQELRAVRRCLKVH